MTQCQRVLDYMKKKGNITPRDAFVDLNVTRLAARIFELKEEGHQFNSEMKNNPVTGDRYMSYSYVGLRGIN